MVSVAEGAKNAGTSEGLGPSGRRPEPGAAGVLGKSGRSHRLRVPRPPQADQRVPQRGELALRARASSLGQAGRARLGTFSVRWRDFPARLPGDLRSGPLRPPRPSRRTPLLASKRLSGAPRLPRPSSWERVQVQRAAGICLRTLLRFSGRRQACTWCAPGRCLFTALREVWGRRHLVAWEGVWKRRIRSGRWGSRGSLRWSESVCSWAPGGTPQNVSAFDPG